MSAFPVLRVPPFLYSPYHVAMVIMSVNSLLSVYNQSVPIQISLRAMKPDYSDVSLLLFPTYLYVVDTTYCGFSPSHHKLKECGLSSPDAFHQFAFLN